MLLAAGLYLSAAEGDWPGVDETVVEKFAEEAGRPPREPYMNTDKGDLLLFLFLVAGAAGGFVSGYCFRELFPSARDKK
ncbi:MAG: cobalt ABC transporter permease [Planctomycetes bacterium]|nr:cobalt ABC transporter permease [Planctomycetota bacterium]